MPVDYSQSKIYKICDNTNGAVYFGSTTQKLYERINDHKKSYRKFLKGKRGNITSFEIIKNNDFNIILVENVLCCDKEQLQARERYYIENFECINKYIPGRTSKQYHEDNKERLKELSKQKYEKNKLELNEIKKIKCVCRCDSTYRIADKARHERTKKHMDFINSNPQ